MEAKDSKKVLDRLPAPAEVEARLAATLREASHLRRLLRLSMAVARDGNGVPRGELRFDSGEVAAWLDRLRRPERSRQ